MTSQSKHCPHCGQLIELNGIRYTMHYFWCEEQLRERQMRDLKRALTPRKKEPTRS